MQSLYRVISYSFDDQGNKVKETYGQQEVEKDGESESWHRIYFSYDKNNHLTLIRDDFGAQMCYDYDCLGNVTLEERVIRKESTASSIMPITETVGVSGKRRKSRATARYSPP